MVDSLMELKERVWRSKMELFEKNLVVHTFGNVSGIDREKNIVAIKPSGIPYPELTPEEIVLVDLKNRVIDI
jgi:L-ribulose-5-phosphate 4-epimerase